MYNLFKITAFAVVAAVVLIGCEEKKNVKVAEEKSALRIISIGPSNTEILVALGFADKIIATDTYSGNVAGIKSEIPKFSMMAPDGEQIVNLRPDIIFVAEISKAGGFDPFKVVADAGIRIIYTSSSSNINGIKEDIRFIATIMEAVPKGEGVIANMEREINDIKKIGDTITTQKTVHFEVSAAPWIYTTGSETFVHEMIELIGAKNIFGDRDCGWFLVADEVVLSANPDVILTSVDYIENPIDEIKSRPGWSRITAVKNDAVYYINTAASNHPSQNIVKALKEMAAAVYPDK